MIDDLKERLERFSIPEPNSGCWLWLNSLSDTGYGRIGVDGVATSSHRASYRAYVGLIPEGLCVLHRCDTRACINPDHLFLGTRKDNAIDMSKKGRGSLNRATSEDRSEWQKKVSAALGPEGRRARALKIALKMTPDQIRQRSLLGGRAIVEKIKRMSDQEKTDWLAIRRACMKKASDAAAAVSPEEKSERARKGWETRRKNGWVPSPSVFARSERIMRFNLMSGAP